MSVSAMVQREPGENEAAEKAAKGWPQPSQRGRIRLRPQLPSKDSPARTVAGMKACWSSGQTAGVSTVSILALRKGVIGIKSPNAAAPAAARSLFLRRH